MNLFNILMCTFTIQSLCQADDLLCQSFNQKAKFFEKYCNNFNGQILPTKCVETFNPRVDSCQVHHLKIGGCGGDVVWKTLDNFKVVRTLDISNSAYKILNWLDATNFELNLLQRFNASHNELTHVRRLLVHANALIEVDLSFNKLNAIDTNSFGRHEKLERILLSHNELTFMALDAFKGVGNLKYIDLSDNFFREMPGLPYSYFIQVIHIERNPIFYLNCPQTNSAMVHLSWSSVLSFYGDGTCDRLQMQIISNGEFEGLSTAEANYKMYCNPHSFRRLYTFIAGRNAFTNVTILLPYLTALVTNLNLSGNYVGSVNATTFELYDRLMILSLSDTALTNFDFQVLKNQNYRLKSLDLSHNALKFIDNTLYLAKFYSLTNLNVAGNCLNNTRELIQHLRSPIKTVDLSENFVGFVNATTFELLSSSLETLRLHNTNLSLSNFQTFEVLNNLQHLDISMNNLTHVNASDFATFAKLNKLIKFNIADCQLRNVSAVIRALGSTIKELDVSGNSIETLQAKTFHALNHLECLNLSNANIVRFNFFELKNLTNLRIFDVSYNKLRYANFEHLPEGLKNLYLEGNDLTEIEQITSTRFPLLESLSIAKNQLSCLTLRQFVPNRKKLYLIGNSLEQKHGKYCRCSVNGILDFLDSVYDAARFW